ncbi:MAG: hypothetical protein AB1644_04895 [Candidatus Zixiibacteriota bacterium]
MQTVLSDLWVLVSGRTRRIGSVITIAVTVLLLLAAGPAGAQSNCCTVRGNCDCDPGDAVDISDLVRLIDFLYNFTSEPMCCDSAANVDADPSGTIDISDLVSLIDYLFFQAAPPPACGSGGAISDSARLAALDRLQVVFDSLLSQSGSFRQDLMTYLQSDPLIEAAGIDSGTGSVWGRFTDGVLYIGVDNRAPASSERAAKLLAQAETPPRISPLQEKLETVTDRSTLIGRLGKRTAPSGLPASGDVASLLTLGPGFAPVNGVIEGMLTSNGYDIKTRDASVNGLKQIGGEGVVYFSTHGGAGQFSSTEFGYSLWTSQSVDVNSIANYKADLLGKRLTIMQAVYGTAVGDAVSQIHLGITGNFITQYWSNLADNALVFIDACGSSGPGAVGLRNAIAGKNGSVYFGWSHPVGANAANLLAKFMFDRLLGANTVQPRETPPQRPFDYLSLFQDLADRNLLVHPSDSQPFLITEFQYVAMSGGFGMLAPSIEVMQVDEHGDSLILSGMFGDDPGQMGHVSVGGEELTILSWSPEIVVANIPNTGAGSLGPVRVTVIPDYSGLAPLVQPASNRVNLTDWTGQFNFHMTSSGSLEQTVQINVHLRADIHSFRDQPHTQPLKSIQYINSCAENSEASASAAGTYVIHYPPEGGGDWTWTWYGATAVPGWWNSQANLFRIYCVFSTIDNTAKLNLELYAPEGCFESLQSPQSYTAPLFVAIPYEMYDDGQHRLDMSFDSQYNILSGTRDRPFGGGYDGNPNNGHLEWTTFTNSFAPDSTEAQ